MSQNYFDASYIDTFASGDSPPHRIDPRIKLVTTIIFIASVVSFGRYAVLELIPFFSFPIILIIMGELPAVYILKKVFIISPIAVLLGIFNPVFDRSVIYTVGSIGITGGWISFISILIRFTLTVMSAFALVMLTGFDSVCLALERLKVPKPFIVQLMFLYRYMFVLTEESERVKRARTLRSFSSREMNFKTFVSIVGHLLIRTLDRAERIYRAMCCRGFDGHIRITRSLKICYKDMVFACIWIALFISFRFYEAPARLGGLVMRFFI